MSHRCVRLLIEDTARSLRDDINFAYGRSSDVDVIRDKKYPFIALDPLNSTPIFAVDDSWNYTKTWNCQMAFYQLDKSGSDEKEYALILDETDLLVDQFINKLNRFAYNSDKVLITTMNQTSFVKATSDILTGHLLSFSIQVADDFDYCAENVNCEVSASDECCDD